ncbi:MAG TPA: DEAD/DEAH box helicase [Candidatus Thermoplasmatota archaeon]|nr:DEAD/DEAH box helicase [Candidatus Thermoplasmatota archaeon]
MTEPEPAAAMPPKPTFSDLGLSREVLEALAAMGFSEPSEIQRQAIPPVLAGRHVLGQAQTGTGKTAAFGIPLIERLSPEEQGLRALVLVPTRELAEQVTEEINSIGKAKGIHAAPIYGGVGFGPQVKALKDGVPIIVGTPGRVMDHMRRGALVLSGLRHFVLDEADRMLDMGFIDDIRWIVRQVPRGAQWLLFSATMPGVVRTLAEKYMPEPVFVNVSEDKLTLDNTEQIYLRVGYRNKIWALYRILETEKPEMAFVFCSTKREVERVHKLLRAHGHRAEMLHGDMSQAVRNKVMEEVRTGQIRTVIATDVLARGIDISHCSHVINYDMPEDPKWYVHRIGRTGRMGAIGKAITFVTREEEKLVAAFEEGAGTKFKLQSLQAGEKDGIRHVFDFHEYADKLGMVHFRLNLGKSHGMSMMRLYQHVNRLARLYEGELGNVDVYETHSEIEVPRHLAERVWKSVHGADLSGHKAQLAIMERK